MKKKHYYALLFIGLTSSFFSGQVGINNANPQSTLDIMGNGASATTKDGLISARLTRQQLAAKVTGTYAAAQTGALVYVTDAAVPAGSTPSIAQTTEISSPGYYFFNGTLWKNVNDGASNGGGVNIYNADGTLTGPRVVTQDTRSLSFTSSIVNAFSVDGTTFSVDAANDRIGIGTAAPQSTAHILNKGTGGTGVFTTNTANIALRLENTGNGQSVIQHLLTKNAAGNTKQAIIGINPTFPGGGVFLISREGLNDFQMDLVTGNWGLSADPTTTEKLFIDGKGINPLRLEGLQAAAASSGTLTVNGTGVVQLRNSSSISAVRAFGNITITGNNSLTNTGTATETFDNLNELSGNTFTAAATGVYKVDFSINYSQRSSGNDNGDGYLGYSFIYLNGAEYSAANVKVTLPEAGAGNVPTYNTCNDSVVVKMAAGNTLTFYGNAYGSTASLNAVSGTFSINVVRVD